MLLLTEFKARPVVVQRLTFVWSVLAMFPLAYSIIIGISLYRLSASAWDSLPTNIGVSVALLGLAWGHFRQLKVAWVFSVLLGSAYTLGIGAALPLVFRLASDFRSGLDLWRTHTISWMIWLSSQLIVWLLLSTLVLMIVVLTLSLSAAGRRAFGIGRKSEIEHV